MDSIISEKIIEEVTTKGVWDTLKKFYGNDEKLKKVKMQSWKNQYKNRQMNDGVGIRVFFLKIGVTDQSDEVVLWEDH